MNKDPVACIEAFLGRRTALTSDGLPAGWCHIALVALCPKQALRSWSGTPTTILLTAGAKVVYSN